MKSARILIPIGTFGAIWFAIFSGVWVLLEPLGGMAELQKYASDKMFIYGAVFLISLLLSITVFSFVSERRGKVGADPYTIGTSRAQYDYIDLLSESEKEIYLLGLSLPTFSLESKIEFLRSKIRSGVRVKIILLNPYSIAALQRPDRLYELSTAVSETCINTLHVLLKLWHNGLTKQERQYLVIALINIHPSVGIIGTEKKVFWSPYLAKATGAKSPYMIHDLSQSKFGDEIQNHFTELMDRNSLVIDEHTSAEDLQDFCTSEGFTPISLDETLTKKLTVALKEHSQ
jgi:hypothetical protein